MQLYAVTQYHACGFPELQNYNKNKQRKMHDTEIAIHDITH